MVGSILTVILVAIVYLILIRFMDLNEKESFGAILTVFGVGAVLGAVVSLVGGAAALDPLLTALFFEGGKFVALFGGLALLSMNSRRRGWSEVGSLMDGVVYGATAGLGFATGYRLLSELTSGSEASLAIAGVSTFGIVALFGLSEGLFGAIQGVGFGLATVGSAGRKAAAIVVAAVAAFLLHWVYLIFGYGNALGGSQGYLRGLIALLIPAALVLAVIITALLGEKRAIRSQLADEAAKGVVTADEMKLLDSFLARRALYWRTFLKGDFSGWRAVRALHNRQVQLAIAEQRGAKETVAERKTQIEAEVGRLRTAVLEAKNQYKKEGVAK
jgi:protease PrsW